MGRSIPFIIGDIHYPSKSAARDAVRELMAKYNFTEKLNNEHKQYCLELFKHHSECAAKIGCGVKDIEVRRDEYGNKHFHLLRVDGSDDNISWVHCIYPKKSKY